MRMEARPIVLLLLAALFLAPAADALTAASRGIRARESSDYSPNTAYDLGVYGCGVTIAVFDSGVDDEHPYLKGKVVAGYDATITKQMWTLANGGNPQPILGTHGTAVAGLPLSHAGKPFFRPEDKPAWDDDDLVGIAPCAWLVDVQFSDVANDPDFESDVLEAYEWALAHKDDDWGDDDPSNDGIDVITMSWSPDDGTDGDDPICQAATAAVDAGIVVLGSAGNSGANKKPELGCPTGADGVISVANIWNEGTITRDDDSLDDSSTWGPRTDDKDADVYEELKPDVAAPGTGVVSVAPSNADGREYALLCGGESPIPPEVAEPQCTSPFGGTSAATPITAGVVALMLEANPALTPAEVREILHQTAERHPDMERSAANLSAKWDHRHGYGMIDAYAAVRMAQTWPGMEAGRDTDADGVRDRLDVAPFDPNVADIVREILPIVLPENATAETIDTDGDLVIDSVDPAPNDAAVADEGVVAAAIEPANETPAMGVAPAAIALAAVALLARKRRMG